LKEKLIMQTYDGASVMSGQIGGLQTLICQEYPFAFFFHCAAHRLNLVLCQSASTLPSVKACFANISAFSSFTSLNPRRKDLFRSQGIEVPHPGDTRWCYRSRTISVIFNKYNSLFLVLESIVDNPQSWDDGSLTQASGLLQYLSSFLVCFLVFVFNKIFEQSSILFNVLQDRRIEFSYGASKIINLCNDETFTETYQSTFDLVGHPSSRSDRKHNYKDIYLQLLNCMVFMLSDRFSDIENFEFLDLVNPNFFSAWKNKVSSTKLNKLMTSYGPLFNFPDRESQLLFICKDRDFHKENASELLEYIYKFNL